MDWTAEATSACVAFGLAENQLLTKDEALGVALICCAQAVFSGVGGTGGAGGAAGCGGSGGKAIMLLLSLN